MLLERKDPRAATPDKENQTPQYIALANRHVRVVETILEWENSNSSTTNGSSHASLPPSAVHRSERVMEIQFRGDNPSTGTVELNPQLALLSAERNKRKVPLDFQDSVSKSPKGLPPDLTIRAASTPFYRTSKLLVPSRENRRPS